MQKIKQTSSFIEVGHIECKIKSLFKSWSSVVFTLGSVCLQFHCQTHPSTSQLVFTWSWWQKKRFHKCPLSLNYDSCLGRPDKSNVFSIQTQEFSPFFLSSQTMSWSWTVTSCQIGQWALRGHLVGLTIRIQLSLKRDTSYSYSSWARYDKCGGWGIFEQNVHSKRIQYN